MRVLAAAALVAITLCPFAGAGDDPDAPYSVSQLRELLEKPAATSLIPELDAADKRALASTPLAAEVKKQAAEFTGDYPVLTYTQYRAFKTRGDRAPYQTPLGQRGSRLSMLA
ncbi:MAG: hypothetical protein WC655_30300, partial [Candidatus Hydrogenedentales bacterium]